MPFSILIQSDEKSSSELTTPDTIHGRLDSAIVSFYKNGSKRISDVWLSISSTPNNEQITVPEIAAYDAIADRMSTISDVQLAIGVNLFVFRKAEELGDTSTLIRRAFDLAYNYSELERWDSTAVYAHLCNSLISVQRDILSTSEKQDVLFLLAVSYENMRDHVKAIKYATKVLEIGLLSSSDDSTAILVSHLTLARSYLELGEPDKSEAHCLNVLKLSEDMAIIGALTEANMILGRLAEIEEKPMKAIGYYYECLELLKEVNDSAELETAAGLILKVYCEMEEYETAYKLLDLVPNRGAQYYYYLAVLKSMDDEELDSALFYGQLAYQFSLEDSSNLYASLYTSNLLYKLYDELDRPSEALNMYKAYLAVSDSLKSISSWDKQLWQVNLLELDVERTVDSARVNTIVDELNERVKSDNKRRAVIATFGFGVLLLTLITLGLVAYRRSQELKTVQIESSTKFEKLKFILGLQNKRIANQLKQREKLFQDEISKTEKEKESLYQATIQSDTDVLKLGLTDDAKSKFQKEFDRIASMNTSDNSTEKAVVSPSKWELIKFLMLNHDKTVEQLAGLKNISRDPFQKMMRPVYSLFGFSDKDIRDKKNKVVARMKELLYPKISEI